MLKLNIYKLDTSVNSSIVIKYIVIFINFLSDLVTSIVNLLGRVVISSNDTDRILIVRGGGIGDIFLIQPLLIDLKRLNYSVDLFLLHESKPDFFHEIFKSDYYLNIYTFSDGRFEALNKIRKNNYRSLYLCTQSNDSLFLLIKRFIILKIFNSNSIINVSPFTLVPNYYLRRIMDKFVYSESELRLLICYFEYAFKCKSTFSFDVVLSPTTTAIAEKYVVILLGSNRMTNKLNLESWIKIVRNLTSKNVYFIGGKSEKDFSESLVLSCNQPHLYNLVGKLKLSESAFVISKAELIISHDTGLMHFASALNKDMVVYFSSRDIRGRWYPFNQNAEVHRSVISCGFCLKSTCPYSNKCINHLV